MIQSMTGYGKSMTIIPEGKISVEIKSLNGKNADINIRASILPKDKELIVRQLIVKKLHRGTIDFSMSFDPSSADTAYEINKSMAIAYYRQIREINSLIDSEFHGEGNINARTILPSILRLPEVLDNDRKQEIVNDENWPQIYQCIDQAIENLRIYRIEEGKSIFADITSKLSEIVNLIPEIEAFEGERISIIKDRIYSKIVELETAVNQERFEQEMIYYLEKLDINEEKNRLRQHCKYFMETIECDQLPGRKLGFIAQEIGREINTTGSKANHSGIQKIVVRMKDELEKIKEQTLNIL